MEYLGTESERPNLGLLRPERLDMRLERPDLRPMGGGEVND